MKQKAGESATDKLSEHVGDLCAKVNVPGSILGFQVRLNLPPFCLLHDVQRPKIVGNMFVDFYSQRFARPQRTAASQQCVQHPVLATGKENDVGNSATHVDMGCR
ncbi:MAG: hypothetical protein ABSH13_10845 [Candidatus Acidiferrum sp.]